MPNGKRDSGFLPTQINGCVNWWRADQGIGFDSSGNVQSWTDIVGGVACTQATQAQRPTFNLSDVSYGGQPTLSFAKAASQGLSSPVSVSVPQPSTLIALAQSDGVSAGWPLQCSALTAGIMINTSALIEGYGGTFLSAAYNMSNPAAIVCNLNGASSSTYVNSSTITRSSGNAGAGALSGNVLIGLANGQAINGKVAEVIVYNRNLTGAEISAVMKYFGARYAQVWS